jgi:hypothetical protein
MVDVGRYAVVGKDSVVMTIALWDGESEWDHGAQIYQLLDPNSPVAAGWLYSKGEFLPPPNAMPVEEPSVVTIDASALAEVSVAVEKATDIKSMREALTQFIDAIQT